MGSIELTAKELLVLSSCLGARSFYGLRDPFRGMTRQEIRGSVQDIKLQTEKHKLATLGFDGSFVLDPITARIISVCAFCESYITLDVVENGGQESHEVLYLNGEQAVSLETYGEVLKLTELSTDTWFDKIHRRYLQISKTAPLTDEKVFIRQSILSEAQTSEPEVAMLRLEQAGCSPRMAAVLEGGFHRRNTYCSIIWVAPKKRICEEFLCVVSEDGMLRLNVENDGIDEGVQVSYFNPDFTFNEMKNLFLSSDSKYTGKETGHASM